MERPPMNGPVTFEELAALMKG
ncbi:MAG: hypothetical protein QOF98_3755, partial [Streptomyces sp.]|nr:hypothetical protein [Streptomyces sp.]